VVATFEGEYDPATGKFTVQMLPTDPSVPGALTVSLPFKDGTTGSNPDNTFELANDPLPAHAPSTGANVCGAGVAGFEGYVQVQSFFRNQTMRNVYAEITFLSDTANNGCNSVGTAPAGTSNGYGLWSYGDIAPGQLVTRPWQFRVVNSTPYTFRGRVMMELDAPVATAAEFDWTPTALQATRSFKPVGSTTAYFVWNGTTFVDRTPVSTGITFTPVGTPGSTFSMVPGAPYARGFTSSNYFVSNAAGAALATAGNFTVCAKIKPGAHPGPVAGMDVRRIYVGKGWSEPGHQGWSLMQMHSGYCFHYRTTADETRGIGGVPRGDVMSFVAQDAAHPEQFANPENYAYDYICGGRNGTLIHSGTHGSLGIGFEDTASTLMTDYEDMAMTSPETIPLVIGAYQGGAMPAVDGGVYEVIFDSRPVTLAVINEIIAAAEGPKLAASTATYAMFEPSTGLPLNISPTEITGADGLTYTLPPMAVAPVGLDGTGLLDPGVVVTYLTPLAEDTSLGTPTAPNLPGNGTGFCLGVELVATGSWAAVRGGALQFADGAAISVSFGTDNWSFGLNAGSPNPLVGTSARASWPASTKHVFKACAEPFAGWSPPNAVRLYVDGVADGSGTVQWSLPDLSLATGNPVPYLEIGRTTAAGPLTGARIRRVFICPTAVAANCN
jgi:hypothetical protein